MQFIRKIRGCKNSVIPDDGSVTKIGSYAFVGCESLTSIVIPDSIKEIDSHAFERCKSLTSIFIPNSVTKIERYAFLKCNSLETIEVEESNKVYCSKNNCLIDIKRNEIIHDCNNSVIPNDESETYIGTGLFFVGYSKNWDK